MHKTLLSTSTRGSVIAAAVVAAAVATLSGCVAYPVYQQPVARLTPAQNAALATRSLDPAERDRLARLDAQVQREDQADIEAQRQSAYAQSYVYSAPAPYYAYPYYAYPYSGYPYYGGFYPWVPGVSLSFGFRGGWGGHRGWGGRGWGGGGHGWGGGGHGHR